MTTMPKCYELLHFSQEAKRQVLEAWNAYHEDCRAHKEILDINPNYFLFEGEHLHAWTGIEEPDSDPFELAEIAFKKMFLSQLKPYDVAQMWINGVPSTLDDFLTLLLRVWQGEAQRSLEKLKTLKEIRGMK